MDRPVSKEYKAPVETNMHDIMSTTYYTLTW